MGHGADADCRAVEAADDKRAGDGGAFRRELHAEPEADLPTFLGVRCAQCIEVVVVDGIEHLLEQRRVVPAVHQGARGLRVGELVRLDEVDPPNLRSIDPEFPSYVVDNAFHEERRGVLPVPPVGVPRALVRHDRVEL